MVFASALQRVSRWEPVATEPGSKKLPQQSIPQLPPPPANQEGRWEVSYKWIPAEATPAAAGPNTPPEPIVPAEPAEPTAPAEPRAVEEKEEEEWKEEWTGTKEEQPWEEDEDQSWGNWQPELAKPVDVPTRDTSNRSRTPPSRTTNASEGTTTSPSRRQTIDPTTTGTGTIEIA